MMMSDWLSPNPPHITDPLESSKKDNCDLFLGTVVNLEVMN